MIIKKGESINIVSRGDKVAKVVVLKRCSFSKEEFTKYMKYVSEERRNYIIKFRRYMDQCRALAAALLVRYMIKKYRIEMFSLYQINGKIMKNTN